MAWDREGFKSCFGNSYFWLTRWCNVMLEKNKNVYFSLFPWFCSDLAAFSIPWHNKAEELLEFASPSLIFIVLLFCFNSALATDSLLVFKESENCFIYGAPLRYFVSTHFQTGMCQDPLTTARPCHSAAQLGFPMSCLQQLRGWQCKGILYSRISTWLMLVNQSHYSALECLCKHTVSSNSNHLPS